MREKEKDRKRERERQRGGCSELMSCRIDFKVLSFAFYISFSLGSREQSVISQMPAGNISRKS